MSKLKETKDSLLIDCLDQMLLCLCEITDSEHNFSRSIKLKLYETGIRLKNFRERCNDE